MNWWILIVAVLGALVGVFLSYAKYIKNRNAQGEKWVMDEDLVQKSRDLSCSFRVINASSAKFYKFGKDPVLIKGLALDWPARSEWEKDKLVRRYGDRKIYSGSEASIVYSGGLAGTPLDLSTIISSLSKKNKTGARFSFDVGVLKSIPELANDVIIPSVFPWDNPSNEQSNVMWHMLSLGPGNSGLPFHVHGKTWISVIHGAKRWFVYPPGFSPPSTTDPHFQNLTSRSFTTVLFGVSTWFDEVYPILKQFPSLSLDTFHQLSPTQGFRPMECVQEAGDIMYLPDGWSHMTLNLGETIGFGGQSILSSKQRFKLAKTVLDANPDDFESLRAVAISLAHVAMEEQSFARAKIEKFDLKRSTDLGYMEITHSNMVTMVGSMEDSWVIMFIERAAMTDEQFHRVAKVLNAFSVELRGLISVGIADCSQDADLCQHLKLTSLLKPNGMLNVAYFYPGLSKDDVPQGLNLDLDSILLDINRNFTYLPANYEGRTLRSVQSKAILLTNSIMDSSPREQLEAFNRIRLERDLVDGGIGFISARSRALLSQAEAFIRRALEFEPFNPESHGLLGELLGYQGKMMEMEQVLTEAEERFYKLHKQPSMKLSAFTMASIYHKFATTYMTKSRVDKAVPLLKKALMMETFYVPALVDLIVSQMMAGDVEGAKRAFHHLEKRYPDHPALPEIQSDLMKMASKARRDKNLHRN